MAYDRVLLVVGPDDRDSLATLVDATVELAEPANATVDILYFFPRDDYEAVMEQMNIDTATSGLTPDEVAQRHESLRELAERLESQGIEYEVQGVSDGNLADRVVRAVERSGADVVVVGGTRRSPTGKAMFGDHAQQILLNSPVPVMYVRRE